MGTTIWRGNALLLLSPVWPELDFEEHGNDQENNRVNRLIAKIVVQDEGL